MLTKYKMTQKELVNKQKELEKSEKELVALQKRSAVSKTFGTDTEAGGINSELLQCYQECTYLPAHFWIKIRNWSRRNRWNQRRWQGRLRCSSSSKVHLRCWWCRRNQTSYHIFYWQCIKLRKIYSLYTKLATLCFYWRKGTRIFWNL